MSAINLETDDLRPVNDFVRARFGKRVSPATLWRWHAKGVNSVRLEVVKFGGCWMTTAAAFAEFVRRQTENCSPAPMDSDAPAERSDAKLKKLAAAGLL